MPFKFAIAIPEDWDGHTIEALYPLAPGDDVELPACKVLWFEPSEKSFVTGPFKAERELAVEVHMLAVFRPEEVPYGTSVYRISTEDLAR